METINIEIGNKSYTVELVVKESDKVKGLSERDSLDDDKGMLFDYSDDVGEKSFWMKDTKIPLDIVFIDEDQEVIKVLKGEPNSKKPLVCDNVAYVLEVNQNSGIKVEDQLEIDSDDNGPVMQVLNQDGSVQMDLWGSERIFSRKNTKVLIKKAKKADNTKSDSDYKSLGVYMFKCIKIQDERTPEYVKPPEKPDKKTEES